MAHNKTKQTAPAEEHVRFRTSVGYFDNFLQALECFRDEGLVVFTEDYFFSKVVDPANVGMCLSRLEGKALNSLSLQNTDKMEAGLKFGRMRECLKGVSKSSELEVVWPVVTESKHMIRMDIIDEDLQFELTTLNTDTVPDLPEQEPIEYKDQPIVGASDLKKAIGHVEKVANADAGSVVFETTEDGLQLRSSDKVGGRAVKKFPHGDSNEANAFDEHTTEISLSYLKKISTVIGGGETAKLHMKDSHPLRIDLDIDDAGDAKVLYIIAPRIES